MELSAAAAQRSAADGEGVIPPEPNMSASALGEDATGLPGSKRVASAEGVGCNLGGPTDSRRANCGHDAGRDLQRQAAGSDEESGFRSWPMCICTTCWTCGSSGG